MAPESTDRNLLFGVLALQADLLDARQFVEACSAWAGRKDAPLADLLVERGWLTTRDRDDIERLLERKLKKHSGDVHASLAAVAGPDVRQALTGVGDADIQHTLTGIEGHGGHVLLSTVAYTPTGRERYTLTRLHARGGIGKVWLAHDQDLGRDVALKELRTDRADSAQLWARFVEEARITGQLEHPSIVPVYELSRGKEGQQTFYTMRFVKGRTLTEAVKLYHQKRERGQAGPLELRELLGAFVGVCNAMAYAHARGVLHRDLKGSNVILGDFGEVMLLDWGLAKVRGQAEQGRPVMPDITVKHGETQHGQALGTPGYMAPEQAEGRLEAIDERSDVYGLGAILFEILTGQPPFQGDDTQEVLRHVIHELPPLPRQLVSGVPRGLEAVCLKALNKEPEKRYPSVAALVNEVRHWLADEPVTAYREPWAARGRRWMGRHRVLVAGAAAAMVVAMVSLAASTALLTNANRRTHEALALAEQREGEAQEQRDQARANFQMARDAVDEYCTKVANDPRLKEKDLEELRRQLLQTAAKFHEKFVQQRRDDPMQKADLGRAYVRLGRLTGSIGDRDKALALLDQAVAIFMQLVADDPESADYLFGMADARSSLANWLEGTEKREQAIEQQRQALTMYEKLVEHNPGESKYALDLGGCYCDYAEMTRRAGRRQEAIPFYVHGIQTLEPLCRGKEPDERAIQYLGNTYECQANNFRMLERPQEGITSCLQALILRKKLRARSPDIPVYQEDQSRTLHVLALLYEQVGKMDEAADALKQALKLAEKAAADHPSVISYKWTVASVQANLALFYRRSGKPQLAVDTLLKALATQQELVDRNPKVVEYQLDVALSSANLGALQIETGQLEKGTDSLHRCAHILNKQNPVHPRLPNLYEIIATNYLLLGELHAKKGQEELAESCYREGLAIRRRLVSQHRNDAKYAVRLGGDYCNQANALRRTKRTKEAFEAYDQAVHTLKEVLAKDAADKTAAEFLGNTYEGLASLYQETGKPDEAEKTYLAMPLRERLAANHPKVTSYQVALGNAKNHLGALYYITGKMGRAAALHGEALAVRKRLAKQHADVADYQADVAGSYYNLGLTHYKAKEIEQAVSSLRQALDTQEVLVAKNAKVPRYQTDLARTCSMLGLCLAQSNKTDEAFVVVERERAAYRRLLQDHPGDVAFVAGLVRTCRKLAEMRLANRQPEQAVEPCREAVDILNQIIAASPPAEAAKQQPDLAQAQIGLGKAYRATGKLDEATAAIERAEAMVGQLNATPPVVAACRAALVPELIGLAEAFRTEKKYSQAAVFYRRAQAPAKELLASDPKRIAYQDYVLLCHLNLGATYALDGQHDQALEAFRQSAPLLDKSDRKPEQMLPNRVVLLRNFTRLGEQYAKQRKVEPAADAFGLAIEQAKRLTKAAPEDTGALGELMMAHGRLGELYKHTGKLEKAVEAYEQQLPIAKRLMEKHPEVPGLAGLRGSTHLYLGQLAMAQGKLDQALDQFDMGIALFVDALKREKVDQLIGMVKAWLRDSCRERAHVLMQFGRPEEAVAACDRGLEVTEGRPRGPIRATRACALACTGEHARAVAEAEDVVKQKDVSTGELYDAACAVSLASAAVLMDKKLSAEEQKKLADHHAARAVALLRQAKAAGRFKARADIDYMKKDTDLDPLRQREDYKELLAELEPKAQ
jgi:serine/threonine-protein kinase